MESLREQLLILITTPVYIIIIVAEILLSNSRKQKTYTFKDTMSNVYMMLANASIDLLFRAVYIGILVYFFNRHFFQVSNPILYWFSLLILEDFLFYWLHRIDHHVRVFWAVHVTHHSSEQMNFAVGFRSSVFQPLYRFIYFIPLALIGFEPADIVFMYSATQIWGIMVHTEMIRKMGWLEYIFVTPSHHRVHHASNPKYLDKNMGMFLIIWDKIFGTFQPEIEDAEYEPLRYGLTTPVSSNHPVTLIFHEWKQMIMDLSRHDIHWKQKLGYLFGPPGWSHDGSRLTSEEMRIEESRKRETIAISHPAVDAQPEKPTGSAFSS